MRRTCRSSLDVEFQPLVAQVKRIIEALEMLGQPLERDEKARLNARSIPRAASRRSAPFRMSWTVHCLIGIEINAESRVKSSQGRPGRGWFRMDGRFFSSRFTIEAGVTAELVAESPNAAPLYKQSTGRAEPQVSDPPRRCRSALGRCDPCSMTGRSKRSLSGLRLEYRIVQIL